MKVCKFGGSSLADAARVSLVCDIISADSDRRITVVSAPGKRDDGDTKVTDLLINCAMKKLAGEPYEEAVEKVVDRFREIQVELQLEESLVGDIRDDLLSRMESDSSDSGEFTDLLKAAGEDNCAKLVASALRARGCKAKYVNPGDAGMLLSDEFGNAELLPESYENLASLKDESDVIIFPGFFGYTRDGKVATFPRGGSDITGSILAAAVGADAYENFTDVDSVFAADPRIVADVQAIKELTFREMRELAYAGFSVLHDEAIVPAVRAGIPIYVKNTARPSLPGTKIVPRHTDVDSRVVGIASSDGFCTVYVSKYLMNREVGFGRRLLQILEEEGLSYEHTPSGIDNMSIILKEDALDSEKEKHVLGRMENELGVNDVDVERGLALVMIVGEGMRYSVGLASKATKALSDANVNIEMMNQGSSEISMMFGVKADGRKRAVESLYRAFFDQ